MRVFRLITVSDMEIKVLEKSRSKLRVDALAIQSGKFNTQSTVDERSRIIKVGSRVLVPFLSTYRLMFSVSWCVCVCVCLSCGNQEYYFAQDEEWERELPSDEDMNQLLIRAPEEYVPVLFVVFVRFCDLCGLNVILLLCLWVLE